MLKRLSRNNDDVAGAVRVATITAQASGFIYYVALKLSLRTDVVRRKKRNSVALMMM